MTLFYSPAKVNCFLRVLHKRKDGYHELASHFRTVSLYDTLHFSPSEEDLLTCDSPEIPLNEENFILKALMLFKERTGVSQCFRITLNKQIPIQAGLGGGSSNGSTTLWALNELCETNLPSSTLAKWSERLGSDQPFFFSSGSAYCTGRGEQVLSLPQEPLKKVWIVKPSDALSTQQVYQTYHPSSYTSPPSFHTLKNSFINDLETPAFFLIPSLQKLKSELLSCGFDHVVMSGSGTSFLCLGEGTPPKREGLQTFNCQFIKRSPSHWYKFSPLD